MEAYQVAAGLVVALLVLAGLSLAEAHQGVLSFLFENDLSQSAIRACTSALDNLGIINEKREQAGLPALQPGDNSPTGK